ncbi:MAG TPA: DUF302 domain-containing protein [Acidiferrobacteraceae bacterium]|nr:DUF302 domain-containing protein [Acidiferrobacteraceae bacterium]
MNTTSFKCCGLRRALIYTLVFGLLWVLPADADELIMVRVHSAFPETMTTLQEVIRKQDYTVSRIQRVDVGLTKTGYQTAEYRVVFFGKPREIKDLPSRYPELTTYLPLKITIFAEQGETLLMALNPILLGDFFPQPELKKTFAVWEKAVRDIFDRVRTEEEGSAK